MCETLFNSAMELEHHKEDLRHWSDAEDEVKCRLCYTLHNQPVAGVLDEHYSQLTPLSGVAVQTPVLAGVTPLVLLLILWQVKALPVDSMG